MTLLSSWLSRFSSTTRAVTVFCGCLLAIVAVAAEPADDHAADSAASNLSAGAPGQPSYVPGTRVRWVLPKGFVPMEGAPGFENKKMGTKLTTVEMPASFHQAKSQINAEIFEAQNMTLLQRKDVKMGKRDGILLALKGHGPQESSNFWMLYFGDDKTLFIVGAGFPVERSKELSQPLRKLLLSVEVDEGRNIDPLADMKFEFVPVAPWKFAFRGGDVLCFTETGGVPTEILADRSAILVSSGTGSKPIDDRASYTETILRQFGIEVSELTIETNEPTDGGGYQLAATGVAGPMAIPTSYYLLVLFEPDSLHYSFLFGSASGNKRDTFQPQFMEMARSFKLKAPSN